MLPFQLLDTPAQSTSPPHWLKLIVLSLLLHAAVFIVWPPTKPARLASTQVLAIQLLMPPPSLAKQPTTNTKPETIRHQANPQPPTPPHVTKTNTPLQNQVQHGSPLVASATVTRAAASPALNLDVSSALANPATAPRQQLVQRHGEKPRQLNTEAPEYETVLSQDLKKAIRKDCRKAYSSMGLLAIPLLMKDSVTDDGCDW